MHDKNRISGRYELHELIGQGGMGEVYRGVDTQTGDAVAIKVLNHEIIARMPSLMARFEREGEALRQLAHPHIVKMLQYPNATFHADRTVLPLRAEHRGRLDGIVHRTSDSGATLFVEPAEAVELNNSIVRLRADENEEISRILWQLTQTIHLNATTIIETLDAEPLSH